MQPLCWAVAQRLEYRRDTIGIPALHQMFRAAFLIDQNKIRFLTLIGLFLGTKEKSCTVNRPKKMRGGSYSDQ
ncbi:MAG: hypothetical protein A3J97_15235 [Spirochaetes bacterium RIFOXYC1_FULL_54_7]|nr:MAG: hypothetical protein A3J97_15235 [Spirochaetes bacterium RIFOXYC1_FULL_54_7]